VDDSADDDLIKQAYEKQREEWEKKQSLIDNEKSLYIKVEEIKRRLAAAHEAMLEKKKLPQLEGADDDELETDEEEIEFEIDEVIEAHSAAEVDFEFDPSEPGAGPEAGTRTDPVEEVRAELVEEKPLREHRPEPTVTAAEPPSGETVPTDLQEGRNERIKSLLYDIKVRKAVNDDEGTISLIYELVELEPENAKYELMLAEALARHPVLSKRAERHYRRALSLDPQNAEFHYRLGLYYKSFDMKSRALAEFKTTLRIDPTHVKARGKLVDLKQTSSSTVEQLFKKFLG
jgi:Flp pilus assembly protein TadD